MMLKSVKTLAQVAFAFITAPAALAAEWMDGIPPSQQARQPVAAVIKKIDVQAGKVALKLGPIASPVTMEFSVKDRASLKNFKEGESVLATFDNVDGKPIVVEMRRK